MPFENTDHALIMQGDMAGYCPFSRNACDIACMCHSCTKAIKQKLRAVHTSIHPHLNSYLKSTIFTNCCQLPWVFLLSIFYLAEAPYIMFTWCDCTQWNSRDSLLVRPIDQSKGFWLTQKISSKTICYKIYLTFKFQRFQNLFGFLSHRHFHRAITNRERSSDERVRVLRLNCLHTKSHWDL